jgi:hypothetical protein
VLKIQFAFSILLAVIVTLLPQAGIKKPRELADYKPRTLKALAENQTEGEQLNPDLTIYGDLRPSRVTVVYRGSARPLNAKTKAAISSWANRYAGNPESYTAVYEKEMLFSEGETEYWIPVRKDLIAEMEAKLKSNDKLDLLLIKLGHARTDGKWAPLLLAERFVKE